MATARVMARLIEGALPTDRRAWSAPSVGPDEPGLTLTLLGTAEAARLLGKSTRTIYRMVNAGTLAHALIAPGGNVGIYLFDRADVERVKAESDAA